VDPRSSPEPIAQVPVGVVGMEREKAQNVFNDLDRLEVRECVVVLRSEMLLDNLDQVFRFNRLRDVPVERCILALQLLDPRGE
jgi:hypothetical protein